MRTVGPRVAAASATLLALLGLTAGSAQGDRVVETIYAQPTAYYVPTGYVTSSSVVPTGYSYVYPTTTSYVYPTSDTYVVPTSTSYVLPASYTTTAYSYLPSYTAASYYVPTYYRRPGLLRRLASRPVYETSRIYTYDATPTTYYQPTTITYDSPLVTTSLAYASPCAETTVPFNPPAPINGNPPADPTTKSVTSTPKNVEEPPYKGQVPEKSKAAAVKDTTKDPMSPPSAPAPEKNDKEITEPNGLAVPPVDTPKDPGEVNRSSFRPVPTVMTPRATASRANMLIGDVVAVSGLSEKPVPNAQVVFSDQRKTYSDRTRTTDAQGGFQISLPNGDWMVKIVDPTAAGGAQAREYGRITSAGGSYYDEDDRPVYRLKLNQ